MLHPRTRVRLDAVRVLGADRGAGAALSRDDRARRASGAGLVTAPLFGWRRLFRVGGAPAAAHATLARAPATERLLDPISRVRLARESSLDALARPLDVGSALARVVEAAADASRPAGADS